MSYIFAPGVTSKSVPIQIVDDSGQPVTGLVAATMPAIYYWVAGANAAVAISLSDLSTITTAYSSGGVKEIDATHFAGYYRLDVPDTAWVAAGKVKIGGEATGKRVLMEVVDVGYVQVDARQWLGGTIPAVNVTGVPKVDVVDVAGVGQTAGDIVGSIQNIAITEGGNAPGVTAASATYTTGSDSGGVANTKTVDGSYDSVTDAAGTIDFYYEFNIATGQVAAAAEWIGYIVGVVNTVKYYIRNFTNSAWDQQGTILGIAGSANIPPVEITGFTTDHTSGGICRVRFQATGLVGCTVKTDRIMVTPLYTPPANWSVQSIDASGRMDVGKILGTASQGAAGYVAPDWGHINAPTTTVDLSGTTVKNLDVLPAGFSAATFPSGTIANQTNITAGTITTTTNLTNLPSIPANWLTAAGIAAGALNGKGDWFLASSAPTNIGLLSIDANGRVEIQSGITKNVAINNFTFLMVDSSGNPVTGATVTATRSLDGSATFSSCANSVSEMANGWYKINLAATDLNANTVSLRFAATGCVDRDISIITTA